MKMVSLFKHLRVLVLSSVLFSLLSIPAVDAQSWQSCKKKCQGIERRRRRRKCLIRCQRSRKICPRRGSVVVNGSRDMNVCARIRFACDNDQIPFNGDFGRLCGCGCINQNAIVQPGTACPVSDIDQKCSRILRPVICTSTASPDGCKYNNLCLAKAAGYTAKDCVFSNKPASECPRPEPDTICPQEFNPTICRKCVYSNPCLASSAGHNVDKKGECRRQNEM